MEDTSDTSDTRSPIDDRTPSAIEASGESGGFTLELDDLMNKLDAFQLFRKNDENEADRVLETIGAHSAVDADIVLELGSKRPLGPDKAHRFLEAHSLAIRSLEVLDRNGHRSVPVPSIGFLTPLTQFLVQLVTQYLVRSYLSKAIDEIHRLYVRREAAALPGDPHRPLLTRARIDIERLVPGFKKSALGLPTFLFGGAVLSGLGGLLQNALRSAVGSSVVLGVVLVAIMVLLALASWVIVRGTAVARHRINLTTRQPMDALWETVGRAGRAPSDSSKTFAVIAIVLMIAGFIVMPLLLVPLISVVR